jgi:hypothetical protein
VTLIFADRIHRTVKARRRGLDPEVVELADIAAEAATACSDAGGLTAFESGDL